MKDDGKLKERKEEDCGVEWPSLEHRKRVEEDDKMRREKGRRVRSGVTKFRALKRVNDDGELEE